VLTQPWYWTWQTLQPVMDWLASAASSGWEMLSTSEDELGVCAWQEARQRLVTNKRFRRGRMDAMGIHVVTRKRAYCMHREVRIACYCCDTRFRGADDAMVAFSRD